MDLQRQPSIQAGGDSLPKGPANKEASIMTDFEVSDTMAFLGLLDHNLGNSWGP